MGILAEVLTEGSPQWFSAAIDLIAWGVLLTECRHLQDPLLVGSF